MNRRDILKGLAALGACGLVFAGTRQKQIGILVKMHQRRTDLCLLRGGYTAERLGLPIGRGHFVNDVACCLAIDRETAKELVRKYGLPPRGEPGAETVSGCERRVRRNPDGSVISVPRDVYTQIVEARASEFAGFVREGVKALRGRKAMATPILVGGGAVAGLYQVIELGALWNGQSGMSEGSLWARRRP